MAKLEEFKELISRFASVADFIIVYIREAHAKDGWSFETNLYDITHHTTIEERVSAAKMLEQVNPSCPVVVDLMDDEGRIEYDALPERLYIIQNGIIAYKGGPGPYDYDLIEIEKWLKQHIGK